MHSCSLNPTETRPAPQPARGRDAGFSLLEILITLSLMGFAVIAVLTGLQSTIHATVADRDHATAFAWLQSASDEIYRADRVSCTNGRTAVLNAYDAAATSISKPPVWASSGATIRVIDVEFLGKPNVNADFEWGQSYCFEGVGFVDSPLYTQRVTIEVTGPEGRITKTLQMVKSD